ncbi:putative polyketide synthase [Aspergillus candidus]|uniref:Polyketide synthase n=1 Tax=Aspergillus candidus TaxID=41067 RepID=A0A2I2F8E8_ASPCN|nr:polyketide synthase [Aspergillus candidus]PLB36893.1 polyketide synthase [Aspergillus candidus]
MTANRPHPPPPPTSPTSVPTPSDTPTTDSQSLQHDDLSILSEDASLPIAIVGMGFRGPGDAVNVQKLWDLIIEGRETWSRIPDSRWKVESFHHPDYARHGTINVEGGHFLEEHPSFFDAPFFNMSSDEAAAMDPQQRLLLEVTYEGLESAGIPLPKIMGSQTACFVGSFNADYTDLLLRDPECVPMYQCTNAGQSRAMTANRISYFFDLKGPSVTVDTACSGSLVALHLACQSLRTGDATMAVAAGVNIILSHEFMSTMTMMKFLSPEGRCHTFDQNANGYARGEAIGSLILKPLKDAIRDHDPIRAIIRGSGTNQDGRTPGITLPSGVAQGALIRHVYKTAGLDPAETEFVEAHGTGTQAGDPIETGALAKVFCQDRDPTQPLRVGSIKTNVGHLEGTSGVAGVIKAILMLENCTFLPSRGFKSLNPRILLDDWKVKIQLSPETWRSAGPHRVSVNSFGYGGSNAHVIVEDAMGYLSQRDLAFVIRSPTLTDSSHCNFSENFKQRRIFMVSAFEESSLVEQLHRLRAYLDSKASINTDDLMRDLAFTLNERRTNYLFRAAVIGDSPVAVATALSEGVKIQKAPRRPAVGFVFTGQGAQWRGMGKELLEIYPVFRQSIQRIDCHLAQMGAPFCILDELTSEGEDAQLDHPLLSQPICSALQIALVDLLASWGVYPDSVSGHSSGEIAAAYAAGALTMGDAMMVAYYRGVVASKLPSKGYQAGGMLALGLSPGDAQPYLESLTLGSAVVACVNSPTSITVSGDSPAIDELESTVRKQDIFCRRLAVGVAYHSHHMKTVGDAYLSSISTLGSCSSQSSSNRTKKSRVRFFSSVVGAEVTTAELGPTYWVENLLGQVKFADAVCSSTVPDTKRTRRLGAARKVSIDCLLEIGPHSALAAPIRQILQHNKKLSEANIRYYSALSRTRDATATTLDMAASLACSGYPVNFQAINDPSPSKNPSVLVDLPTYSWNHSRSYWAEPRISKAFRSRKHPRTNLLGVVDRGSCPFEPRWKNFLRVSEDPWLADHKIQSNIVYPAAGYVAMAIEAVVQHAVNSKDTNNFATVCLQDVSIKTPIIINETLAVEVMISLQSLQDATTTGYHRFRIYSVTEESNWTEHCQGVICLQATDSDSTEEMESFEYPTSPLSDDFDLDKFYTMLSDIGLEYGPTFTNIKHAHFTSDTSIAQISIPDTASVMPEGFEYPHLIHPCTLDSIIQTIFINMDMKENPAVPVYIKQMIMSMKTPRTAGTALDTCTKVRKSRKGDLLASISVLDNNGSPAISIAGLQCRNIQQSSMDTVSKEARLAYRLEWSPDPGFLVQQNFRDVLEKRGDDTQKHFWDTKGGEPNKDAIPLTESPERLPTIDERLGFLTDIATKMESLGSFADAVNVNIAGLQNSNMIQNLLPTLGGRLSDIMAGSANLHSLADDAAILEAYWTNAYKDQIYQWAAVYIDLVSRKNPMISVLELESGSGDMSRTLLQRLMGESKPRCIEYTLAHSKQDLLDKAKPKLSQWQDWLGFVSLDIEGDLNPQSSGDHLYDVVIAPRGIHTVKHKQQALKNMHALLRKGGHLVLVDPPTSHQQIGDSLRSCGVLGSNEGLQHGTTDSQKFDMDTGLKEAGFCGIAATTQSPDGYTMVLSRPSKELSTPYGETLIVTGKDAYDDTVRHLRALLALETKIVSVADLTSAMPRGKFCIVFNDIGSSVLSNPNQMVFSTVKQIFLESAGVLWVTTGGTINPSNPNAGIPAGFARTARSESGAGPIITLDLDSESPSSQTRVAEIIYDIIRQHASAGDKDDRDTEYAERRGTVFIPRLVEDNRLNRTLATSKQSYVISDEIVSSSVRPLRAVIDADIGPGGVHFENDPDVETLPEDCIRIAVHAVSTTKQGLKPDLSRNGGRLKLGSACSGVVQAVGDKVSNFAPNDRVACLGLGTVASLCQGKQSAFQKIPSGLDFDTAAILPLAYCMAFYAVHHLAHVVIGDRALVVCEDKTLGHAFAEVINHAKGQTFLISGGGEETSATSFPAVPGDGILRHGSTTAKELKKLTGDSQVDIIVNCMEPISSVHSLWSCMSAGGRFIQLIGLESSARPVWEVPRLEGDCRFATCDFTDLLMRDSNLVHGIWSNVASHLRDGDLHEIPLPPRYNVSNLADGLDALESDPRVQSILVTIGENDVVKTLTPKEPSSLFRPNTSYVLVGGLGGIGRATSIWMAENGARTLVFLNRSGLSQESSKAAARALKEKGVRVIVRACDVSDSDQVSKIMRELKDTAPPIRGLIHAAMVVKDSHIEKMTLDDYLTVLRPKTTGTWNLHRYLPQDLDFFLMLSSISGIIGNATQAAYAAGSTFMDAFAAHRRTLGLPAVSLDLGVITDVGYLAENRDLASRMAQQGFHGTDTPTLLTLISTALTPTQQHHGPSAQIITGLGDYREDESLPILSESPLFSHFRHIFSAADARNGKTGPLRARDTLRADLSSAPSIDDAVAIVYAALCAKIAANLSIPTDAISPTAPIAEYGIDSHVAVELRKWIARTTDSTVSILEILGSTSLMELAGRVAGKSGLVSVE